MELKEGKELGFGWSSHFHNSPSALLPPFASAHCCSSPHCSLPRVLPTAHRSLSVRLSRAHLAGSVSIARRWFPFPVASRVASIFHGPQLAWAYCWLMLGTGLLDSSHSSSDLAASRLLFVNLRFGRAKFAALVPPSCRHWFALTALPSGSCACGLAPLESDQLAPFDLDTHPSPLFAQLLLELTTLPVARLPLVRGAWLASARPWLRLLVLSQTGPGPSPHACLWFDRDWTQTCCWYALGFVSSLYNSLPPSIVSLVHAGPNPLPASSSLVLPAAHVDWFDLALGRCFQLQICPSSLLGL